MKITVDTNSLVTAVNWVTKLMDPKGDLVHVVLSVDKKGAGSVSHGNQTSFSKAPVEVLSSDGKDIKVILDGPFLKRLAPVLSKVSDPAVLSFEAGDSTLSIKAGKGAFSVPMFDIDVPNEPKVISVGEVDEQEFFSALSRIGTLCDTETTGFGVPALSTVDTRLDAKKKTITMMATDRYALSEMVVSFSPTKAAAEFIEDNENVFIPAEVARMVNPGKDASVSVSLVHEQASRRFGYQFADGRITIYAMKDAMAIKYQSLKETCRNAVESSLEVELAVLKGVINNVTSVSGDANIMMTLGEDGLSVGDSLGQNTMEVPVEEMKTDATRAIPFAKNTLMKALAPITTQKVLISWRDADAAFVIDPILSDGTIDDKVFVFANTFKR